MPDFKETDLYNLLLYLFIRYETYEAEICNELMNLYIEISNQENNIVQEMKCKNEIQMLKNKKDKLLDLTLDGILNEEELKIKKISIEKEIFTLETKLKELEGKKSKQEKEKDAYKKLRENIGKELIISKNNIEDYIDELIDKIRIEVLE